ncbi:MAG: type II secretion system protein [bacterium]
MNKKGFTLGEIMIVIGIMVLLAGLTSYSFVDFSNYQSLDNDSYTALSYIQKARSLASNSYNFSEYGVRVSSTSLSVFQGKTYSPASTTLMFNFSSKVIVSSIALSNSSTEFYFNKVTGKSNATGTITFKLNNGTTTKNIIINSTGLPEIQ